MLRYKNYAYYLGYINDITYCYNCVKCTGSWILASLLDKNLKTFLVRVDDLPKVISFFYKHHNYNILVDLFGADFPDKSKRFEITYILRNLGFIPTKSFGFQWGPAALESYSSVKIKVFVKELQPVPSLHFIFKASGWCEREI